MDGLEVLDRGRTPEVEEVPSDADVGSGVALSSRYVRDGMFDVHALAKVLAASHGLLQTAKLSLQAVVVSDRDPTR